MLKTFGKLRSLLALLVLIFLSEAALAVTELLSQKELSRTVDVFRASRYVVYDKVDDDYYYFHEESKFGVLGPSQRFKISKKIILIKTIPKDSVITYDQNNGVFEIGLGSFTELVQADFSEGTTREEDLYLAAAEKLSEFDESDLSEKRIEHLKKTMLFAYSAGHYPEAAFYAKKLIDLVTPVPWKSIVYSTGIHYGNKVLGLLALKDNDVELAKSKLLASAKIPGSPALSSFGPNTLLAFELLQLGEKKVVLEYLILCRKFWKREQLETWITELERGVTPKLDSNIYY